MIVCGIDPGKTGAIALIEAINGKVLIHDIPLNAKGNFIDSLGITDILKNTDTIWLEQVASRPHDGRSSLAGFMTIYGGLRATCLLTGKDTKLILPQVWKKKLSLIKQPKDASLDLAKELYPEASHYLKRKKDHNRAEALLIAHYGRLYFEHQQTIEG